MSSKAVIVVCSVALVALVAFAAVMIGMKNAPQTAEEGAEVTKSTKAVKSMCQSVNYKKTCEKTLTDANHTSDPKDLILLGFQVGEKEIRKVMGRSTLLKSAAEDPRTNASYFTCKKLMNFAIDDLRRCFKKFDQIDDADNVHDFIFDLRVWISSAITSLDTCNDVFQNTTGDTGEKMKKLLKTSMEIAINGLDIITNLEDMLTVLMAGEGSGVSARKLLSEKTKIIPELGEYPSWVTDGRRSLLHSALTPDVVVAQDGSGKYRTINEALRDVPPNNIKPFIIHIKAGTYVEQVLIGKPMCHVVLVGDGPTQTRITGDKSEFGGKNIFENPTVGVDGTHFIAKDIGFENTAGSKGQQAVALRISGDMAIVYNCHIDGYQDTLYAHKNRQFYRDCTISGTIDFIFGDAVSIFQNCKILVRRPDSDDMQDQSCMVTAQGRKALHMPTGIVLQNCLITADKNYYDPNKPAIKSYLGRPWKVYSRTVIMNSQIDSVIEPQGWEHWPGTPQHGQTCWYAEYKNSGPGANPGQRVKWPCIKQEITPAEAAEFTPLKFLGGDLWIPQTGVPYVPGMIEGPAS